MSGTRPCLYTARMSVPAPRIATHSGRFHADDVFGVAVLLTLFPDYELVRSRRAEVLDQAAFVVDVGGVWDAARGRYDHHQRGFDGARPPHWAESGPVPGVGYASAGLVWSEHGVAYVRAVLQARGTTLDDATAADIARSIDQSLVQYLDLADNGQMEAAPGLFGLSALLAQVNAQWLDEQGLDAGARARLQDERFRAATTLVRTFLDHAIVARLSQMRARDAVRGGQRLCGGRVLHLREPGLPWESLVVAEMPDVLLVIYPDSDSDQWQLKTVPVEAGSFVARMDLPASWAGLQGEALAVVTGVADSVFCHVNRFIAGARSFAGTVQLAELALAAAGR